MSKLESQIYNMDCLEGLSGVPDSSVDMVVTDPPYGVGYQNQYTRQKHKRILNDDQVDYYTIGLACYRVLKENTHAYFFTRFDVYPEHYRQLEKAGFVVKNVLVVEKGHIGGLGDLRGSYANNSEWVIFCQKGRRPFSATKLMKNNKPIGKKCARSGKPVAEYKSRFNACWFGECYPKATNNAMWQKQNDVKHPTVKNVEFLEWLIRLSSDEGDLVLDPFMGSGTTAIACMNTRRRYLGYEIDTEYFNLCLDRVRKNEGNVIPK